MKKAAATVTILIGEDETLIAMDIRLRVTWTW